MYRTVISILRIKFVPLVVDLPRRVRCQTFRNPLLTRRAWLLAFVSQLRKYGCKRPTNTSRSLHYSCGLKWNGLHLFVFFHWNVRGQNWKGCHGRGLLLKPQEHEATLQRYKMYKTNVQLHKLLTRSVFSPPACFWVSTADWKSHT